MKISELIKKLNEFYPLDTEFSWDNSGLQIGNYGDSINKAYVCLDLEDFHVDEAIKMGANLIVTHHPLIFKGIKSLCKNSFYYDMIKKLLSNEINVLSYHTPFDISKFGMSNFFINELKIDDEDILTYEENRPLGIVFNICSKQLSEIVDYIKDEFSSKYGIKNWHNFIRVYGNMDNNINRIAYLGGSGADFISDAIDTNADLYITGDIKYHDAQFAYRNGLNLIDLSHGISEIHFVDIMSDKLGEFGLDVIRNYWTFDRTLVE